MPFVIYADFESVLKKPAHDSNPRICQVYEAFSVGYYLKCSYDDSLSRYEFYRGPEPTKWFIKELREFAKFADMVFDSNNQVPMIPLTPAEEEEHKKATECHICGIIDFEGENRDKVLDHCHLSGKYRGTAHRSCNINYKISHTISVVFHNLSFDSKLKKAIT